MIKFNISTSVSLAHYASLTSFSIEVFRWDSICQSLLTMQMGLVAGFGLLVLVASGLYFGAGVFTTDKNVLHLMYLGIPVYSR